MSYMKDAVYFEVMEVLKVKQDTCQKIPQNVLSHIEKHAKKYQTKTDKEITLSTLSDDAFSLYLALYLQYIAENEEKEKIKKILIENEVAYRQKMKK